MSDLQKNEVPSFLNALLLKSENSEIPGELSMGNLTANAPPITGERAGN